MTAHGLHNEIRISHCDRGCDELQKWFLFFVGQKQWLVAALTGVHPPYLLLHLHCESLVSQSQHLAECILCFYGVLVSSGKYSKLHKAEFQDETPFYNWLDSLQGAKPPQRGLRPIIVH